MEARHKWIRRHRLAHRAADFLSGLPRDGWASTFRRVIDHAYESYWRLRLGIKTMHTVELKELGMRGAMRSPNWERAIEGAWMLTLEGREQAFG